MPLWVFAGLWGAGVLLGVVGSVYGGGHPALWLVVGVLVMAAGMGGMAGAVTRAEADARGLRYRTLWRRRSVAWPDVAELGTAMRTNRGRQWPHVRVVRRDGRSWVLYVPGPAGPSVEADFEARLAALRALHRRYG